MKALLLALLISSAFAQSSMDELRWWLEPSDQEILIAIDDLHDETIRATSEMDWGRRIVPELKLKKDLVIAVIDGGIDIEHPELKDRIAYNTVECLPGNIIPPDAKEDKDNNGLKGDCAGWNFIDNNNRAEDLDGHGTHVTGVMNSMLTGVQGSFSFLPLSVFAPNEGKPNAGQNLSPLPTRLVKAFEYAIARKVDVIHLSVGWPKSYMTFELETTIKKAIAQGIFVVSAAGNSSQRANIYPCQTEGVICVGALRANGDVARFSNWGMQVDLFAPGERILSTLPYTLNPTQISRKGYDFKNGTSQAAPFISGALALLRGLDPDAIPAELYARLMLGASKIPEGKGLRGEFHLDRSVNQAPRPYLQPVVKGLSSVTTDTHGNFTLNLSVKNHWIPSGKTSARVSCPGVELKKTDLTLPPLLSGEKTELLIQGQTKTQEFICSITLADQDFSLNVKALLPLASPRETLLAPQSALYVATTRTGARSRLLTLNAVPSELPAPFYYVSGVKDPVFYYENKHLGSITMKPKCNLLRLWQTDLDLDGKTDIMMESMCDQQLSYRFFNQDLKELWSEVTYRPTLLVLINYTDFTIIKNKDAPPKFRFISVGLGIPSTSPWESNTMGRAPHLYELFPVKDGEGLKYDIRVLEDTKAWQKALKLRVLPNIRVFHLVKDILWVRLGEKMAKVDINTQAATWAPELDRILIDGTKRQKVEGSELEIVQGFLTPYEYRGHLPGGVTLKLTQKNKFDPLIDILGTQKNSLGFLTVLQSFQKLLFLQFDEKGAFLSRTETTVDRFDFLSTQDLLASVVNMRTPRGMIQFIDGTKINTNYVDVVIDGKLKSYAVPSKCVTQQPVMKNEDLVLPLICPVNNESFEMQFIPL